MKWVWLLWIALACGAILGCLYQQRWGWLVVFVIILILYTVFFIQTISQEGENKMSEHTKSDCIDDSQYWHPTKADKPATEPLRCTCAIKITNYSPIMKNCHSTFTPCPIHGSTDCLAKSSEPVPEPQVRCPKWQGCKPYGKCPHKEIHERQTSGWLNCTTPPKEAADCPVCVPVAKEPAAPIENPYKHDCHITADCPCELCDKQVVWQEGFEAGLAGRQSLPSVEEIAKAIEIPDCESCVLGQTGSNCTKCRLEIAAAIHSLFTGGKE